MPGLLLCIVIVRKLSSNPNVPVVVVVHRSGSGGRGWPRDVAIELYGLSPGIGVALVAWVLEAVSRSYRGRPKLAGPIDAKLDDSRSRRGQSWQLESASVGIVGLATKKEFKEIIAARAVLRRGGQFCHI